MENVAQIQQVRDLLECVWPAAIETARQPFRSKTSAAAMTVIVDRDGGDLVRTHKRGWARFERAVRREISKRGGQRPSLRIARNLFAALADPAGVNGWDPDHACCRGVLGSAHPQRHATLRRHRRPPGGIGQRARRHRHQGHDAIEKQVDIDTTVTLASNQLA